MISIVTPAYNAIEYIDDTINMVLRQTYTDWEWIIVEDGSTDGTRQLLQRLESSGELDARIHPVYLDDNKDRAAGARNRGIDEAKGEYIAFLDVDDVWMPDKLKKQYDYMQQEDVAFSFTGYEFGDENAIPTGRVVHVPKTLTYKQALSRTVIFTTTVMFDMKKLDKDMIHMPCVGSEDTATWWKILRSGVQAYGIDEVLAIYRRPSTSLSSNKMLAIKRIWNLYRNVEGLGILKSSFYFCGWAYRATVRRL
ncbi:MAG: glycosyltransferase family 2 protein [Lachnospiraceae bacterium]|nr:glycosyltransferase family 2 protein [Candidatus Colinaster equi]